jgi:hypothetical protein
MEENQNFSEEEKGEETNYATEPPVQPAAPTGPEKPGAEKMEFLKREEIQTMQRDISQLRETEAQKERERISNIDPGRGMPMPPPPPPDETNRGETAGKSVPPVIPEEETPQKSFSLPKIFIRVIAVIGALLIIGFFYWFFAVRSGETTPPKEEEIATTTETSAATTTELIIPAPLFALDATQTIEITNAATETTAVLAAVLIQTLSDDTFTRIVIVDKSKNAVLGLRDLLNVFQAQTPEETLGKFDNDPTLFVYSNKGTNRFGLVIKTNDSTSSTALIRDWESVMEQDTTNVFTLLGKTGSGQIHVFKQAVRKGIAFRYISFKPEGLGICWAAADDKIIFTTSGEAMVKIIDRLTQ